MILNAC
jgi:hypothetical protein